MKPVAMLERPTWQGIASKDWSSPAGVVLEVDPSLGGGGAVVAGTRSQGTAGGRCVLELAGGSLVPALCTDA